MRDSKSKYSVSTLGSLELENGESIFSSSESEMSEKSLIHCSLLAGVQLGEGIVESGTVGNGIGSQKLSLYVTALVRGQMRALGLISQVGSMWIVLDPTTPVS